MLCLHTQESLLNGRENKKLYDRNRSTDRWVYESVSKSLVGWDGIDGEQYNIYYVGNLRDAARQRPDNSVNYLFSYSTKYNTYSPVIDLLRHMYVI